MKNGGWARIHRTIFDSWLSDNKPWCDAYAWVYIFLHANYKSKKVNFRNEYIEVERGQFVTSKRKLSSLFGWSRKRIDSFLKALENDEKCTHRVSHRYIVITVLNYEKYQTGHDEQGASDGARGIPTGEPQRATTNKDNKDKERIKNTYIDFFDHWNSKKIVVHRKLSEKQKTKISASLKVFSEPEILKGIENYAKVVFSSDHYFSHKWTLQDFLARGLSKFVDEADPLENFKKERKGEKVVTHEDYFKNQPSMESLLN